LGEVKLRLLWVIDVFHDDPLTPVAGNTEDDTEPPLLCPFDLNPVDIVEPQSRNVRHPSSLKKAKPLQQRQRFDDHPPGLKIRLCHDEILEVTHHLGVSIDFSHSDHRRFTPNLVGSGDPTLFPVMSVVFTIAVFAIEPQL